MIEILLILIALILLLLIGYLLMLRGRTGHPDLPKLKNWSYAHRGLHDDTKPENSIAAFQAALEHGYGIELDVHLLSDGNLAVMHDSLLLRTTGQDGVIEDLTVNQLTDYHLENTRETIPEFRQVLELFQGKAPLIIEIKTYRNNYAALAEAVCNILDSYRGPYCLESFDPRCIYWLKKHRPEFIRGQLAENFLASKINQPWILKWFMTANLLNFLTKPDFVAYKFADRNRLGVGLCRKLHRLQGVTWTLKTQAEYETAVQEDWLPIFENFRP